MKYTVTRQHWGDRQYMEGDIREVIVKADADLLINMGLITESGTGTEKQEKAAPKPQNKMAKKVANKAE